MPQPLEVFISFVEQDEAFYKKLDPNLVTLQREEVVSTWHPGRILPGRQPAKGIQKHLESSQIIILLLSQAYLATKRVYQFGVKRALERQEVNEEVVTPVIIKPCDWKNIPLMITQVLPRLGKPIPSGGVRQPLEVFYWMPVNSL